jgi:ClpP class serine protease
LAESADLFTGEVWTGANAVALGLTDGVGTARAVLTERYPDADLVPVDQRKPLLARLGLGAAPAARLDTRGEVLLGLAEALEVRATWARYGL